MKPAAALRDVLDLVAIAISVGLVGLVAMHSVGLPRILFALAFAFFVPGRAIVSNWPKIAYWSEFGMSVLLSLAALTFIATAALWSHEWRPLGFFEGEAVVAAAALLIGLSRRHLRDRHAPRGGDAGADRAGAPSPAWSGSPRRDTARSDARTGAVRGSHSHRAERQRSADYERRPPADYDREPPDDYERQSRGDYW